MKDAYCSVRADPCGDTAHEEQGPSAVDVASPGVCLESWSCSSKSLCELAQRAADAEPSSELCCFRAARGAGSSRSDDKIYLRASPRPDTSNVPYIRTETYISCFHPPSDQYRWFCFLFQSSGKGARARHRSTRRTQMPSSRALRDGGTRGRSEEKCTPVSGPLSLERSQGRVSS